MDSTAQHSSKPHVDEDYNNYCMKCYDIYNDKWILELGSFITISIYHDFVSLYWWTDSVSIRSSIFQAFYRTLKKIYQTINKRIIYHDIDILRFYITSWWINSVSIRSSTFQAFCRTLKKKKNQTINKDFMGTFVSHSSWFAFPQPYC